MKLGSLAEIKIGLILARKEGAGESSSRYRALTVKSVDGDGIINDENIQPFRSKALLDGPYLAKPDDVVVRLTPPYTAAHIHKQHAGILIPSHFAIITLKDSSVLLPEFLTVFVNSNYAKKEIERLVIKGNSTGLTVNTLSLLELKEITVAEQRKIIELTRLQRREKALYQRLIAEKELFYQETITRIMN